MRLGLLAAAWLGGVLLGLSTELGMGAALLLAGAAALTAIGLRLGRLPAMPAVLAAVLLLAAGAGRGVAGGTRQPGGTGGTGGYRYGQHRRRPGAVGFEGAVRVRDFPSRPGRRGPGGRRAVAGVRHAIGGTNGTAGCAILPVRRRGDRARNAAGATAL